MDCYRRSIEVILQNQHSSGSYVASPNFPTYHYCWLRDGSFIAHAMDRAGEFTSAEAFYRWVGRTIQKHGNKVEEIKQHLDSGLSIGKDDVLHTRYTLDGEEVMVDSAWGNFQIDGYGTWLWALVEHVRLSGNAALINDLIEPIRITLRYLDLVWQIPNYDCWEEHPEYLHLYSLTTVFAGFNSIACLQEKGLIPENGIPLRKKAEQVKEFLLKYAVFDGKMVKHIWPARNAEPPKPIPQSGVDASLIGVAVPYGVLALDDVLVRKTIQSIEADLLRPGGGVYRYKADVYYGGGEWILLTAWLGWYYVQVGEIDKAKKLIGWIESQASTEGFLPEQVNDFTLSPEHYEPWLKKWGPVASPLLWSHAMYIIFFNEIKQAGLK
jgi:GH15 family glucan-1,4-alpha-glucosidase